MSLFTTLPRPTLAAPVITEYSIPIDSGAWGITSGPDGNLWFTDPNGGGKISRITTAGVVTDYSVPTATSFLADITGGSDGNLWFTEQIGNKIGRITTTGVITEYVIPTTNSGPTGITSGPDGNIWFTEINGAANKIGKLEVTNPFNVSTTADDNVTPPTGSLRKALSDAGSQGGVVTITFELRLALTRKSRWLVH